MTGAGGREVELGDSEELRRCGAVDDVDVMLLLLLREKNCKDETLQKRRTL